MTQQLSRHLRGAAGSVFAATAATLALTAPIHAAPAAPTQVVAKVSTIAPAPQFFVLEATLPVPPGTFIPGTSQLPLAIALGTETYTTQIEVVSHYADPSQGADVLELIARVRRPSAAMPGDEIEFDVIRVQRTPSTFHPTDAVSTLIASGGIVLSANDLFGNEYRADLVGRVRDRHPSVEMIRNGAFLREMRSHEVMQPTTLGSGPTAPAPHMLGAHVFTRTYANEDFLILDVLLHNGMVGDLATPLDDPIHDIYFDELVLDLPSGWSMAVAHENPGLAAPVPNGARTEWPLVRALRYGQFHMVPQQSQFMRRIVVARGQVALERGLRVLHRETRGFCVPGERLWSWWNPLTARFQATKFPLPNLEHLSLQGLRDGIQNEFDSHSLQIRSGAEGGYPRYSSVLGWAHPYGVGYGGMTGGDEIEMYPNVVEAWVRDPVALRKLELRSRSYVDRQPIALFDIDGHAPLVEDHIVDAGTSNAHVPTYFHLRPSSSNYFGLQSADRRFMEAAYMTARVPFYGKDLEDFMPIDFQHYTRYLNPHLGLVWLANDSLSKLQLELSCALFRFSFHKNLNSNWGHIQGTGLRQRIEDVAVNPGQGGEFGRGVGWALMASVAHYSVADTATRTRLYPWLRMVAETASSSQSVCTGNPTAIYISKSFKGFYRTRQSFEVGYFVNAAEAMRKTAFEGRSTTIDAMLVHFVAQAAYSTVSPPFWNSVENGQNRQVAARPTDLTLPEFCFNLPANGIANISYVDHESAMPAWSYAYQSTRDALFMQRSMEAVGGTGNVLTELEARGIERIHRFAPLLALMQLLQ